MLRHTHGIVGVCAAYQQHHHFASHCCALYRLRHALVTRHLNAGHRGELGRRQHVAMAIINCL